MPQREIFVEYTQIGHSMRVVAVDAETGTEVSFQAPLGISRKEMERVAVDKLMYVMKKRKK
jgi:hypothetical protein